MYGDYFLIIHSSKCCIAYIIWIFKLFARFSLTHLQCHIWIYFLLSLPFHCRTHFSVLFVRSSCSRFLHWLAFKFSNFQIVIVTYFTWNVFDFKPKNVSQYQYRNKEARRERKWTKETWNLNGNRLLHSFNADFIQWKRNKKREACGCPGARTSILFSLLWNQLWDNFNILMQIWNFDSGKGINDTEIYI